MSVDMIFVPPLLSCLFNHDTRKKMMEKEGNDVLVQHSTDSIQKSKRLGFRLQHCYIMKGSLLRQKNKA